jgi:UDP-glucose:(heptosyl)LPS alpha-1,3-glucosyltransferase
MRVALAARNLRGKTGISAIVLEQIQRFAMRGATVDLLGEKVNERLVTAAGGQTIRFQRLPAPQNIARRWFAARVDRHIRKHRYDLVIGNSDILNQDALFIHNLPHMERAVLPGAPSRGLLNKINFDDHMFANGKHRLCIANSEFTRKDLLQHYNLPPESVAVAHPGYDPERFSPRHRERLRMPIAKAGEIVVGFITSGHYAKRGADILAATLAQLAPELRKRIKLLAVGSAANTSALQELLRPLDMANNIIAKDKSDEVEKYYATTDLLFYPARMEEFGLVVLESAASGTPVLTSAKVGAAELLGDSRLMIAPEPSAAEFAPRLTELLQSPEKITAAGKRQQELVAGNTWDEYFSKVFALYSQLLQRPL